MIIEEMAAVLEQQGLLKCIQAPEDSGTERFKAVKQPVTWLTCDSRQVRPGTVFICKGAAFRPEYLSEAAGKGAVAYISETARAQGEGMTGILVTDIRRAMAAAAAAFFGYQPGKPKITGITGTKGKTTTAWYLKAMLDAWTQSKTALLSTIQNFDGAAWADAVMTTPEPVELHEFIARTQENGSQYLTMEVSSQALKYKRVRELAFQVGIFLNISEDHISPQEHVDFEDYFSAKLSMFRQCGTACINLDSDHTERILKAARKAQHIVTFGRHPRADIRYSNVRTDETGISFTVTCDTFKEQFKLAMKGRFNIENAMAAITAAYVYGVPVSCMKTALAQTRVPGRMETFFSSDGNICGIVDFAHNRLSFEKLFDAVYQEYSSYKKIITVFGCPGGKALNRRRELGIIAGLFSDYVLVTSDDPGVECQEEIAQEIRSYVEMTGCACICIEERWEAVMRAVEHAGALKEKTLILLLGKGSERFQKIGTTAQEYPTDSRLLQAAISAHEGFTFQKKCIMMDAS